MGSRSSNHRCPGPTDIPGVVTSRVANRSPERAITLHPQFRFEVLEPLPRAAGDARAADVEDVEADHARDVSHAGIGDPRSAEVERFQSLESFQTNEPDVADQGPAQLEVLE